MLEHVTEYSPAPASDPINAKASGDLTVTELKVLDAISEGILITTDEMAEAVGVTSRTIKTIVSTLRKRGLIKRAGSRRSGRWVRL